MILNAATLAILIADDLALNESELADTKLEAGAIIRRATS